MIELKLGGDNVDTLSFDVNCTQCHTTIHVPFFRELEARAIEEYDLLELDAQAKLSGLKLWLSSVSLFGLIRFWLKR